MSTCTNEFREGAVGAILEFTIAECDGTPIDLTDGTVTVDLLKPDGTVLANEPAIITDAPNGVVQWTSEAGDLTPAGFWEAEPNVTTPTYQGPGSRQSFIVTPAIA